MATDLATLAIKVENGDVVKATTSLNSMEVAGTKAEASTNRLTRRMALLEIQAREMDASLAKSQSTTGKLVSAMGLTEEAAAKLGKAFGALSVVATAGFLGHKLIEETIASQNAMAQLEASVTATGGAAGRTVAQMDELSLALQKTTTFSDEAVKGAEAILLTFSKIKGDNLDRATAAVTNLATKLGKDLPEAALQVGKALQDPVEGLNALTRLGIRFSASQKQTIQDLVDTGHAAQAQDIILKELEGRYAGAAEAARNTLGGALKGLANDFGDLFEVSKGGTSGVVDAIHGLDSAVRTLGQNMGTVVTAGELVAALFAGRMVAGLAKAAAAQVEVASAAGAAITIQREAASNAVATATAQEASAARAVAALRAEAAEIEALIVLERERAAAARATSASVAFQVTPTNTGATGPAADYYGRRQQEAQNTAATAARTAAIEAEAAAITAEEALEVRRAGVIGQATAVEIAATEATVARTVAVAREGEVIAATSLLSQAGAAATGFFGKAITALGGPIGATIILATALNAALDAYEAHMLKGAEQTEEQRQKTEAALASAHARAAAQKKEADEASESARKFAALSEQRTTELGKLTALNGAYRESATSLQILGIQYDAHIQKLEDAKEHHGRQLAILNSETDAITRQKVAQVLLTESLKRYYQTRDARDARADTIRGAQQDVVLAGQDPATAERTRNRFEELNKIQAAARTFDHEEEQNVRDLDAARARGDTRLMDAIQARRAASKQELDEAVAGEHRRADLADEAITKAREAATKLSVGLTVTDTEAQTAGLRAMIAAELEGGKAVEAMRVHLAGNEAVQRAVNEATARGSEVTAQQAADLRRTAEEYERVSIAAEKVRAIYQEVGGAVSQALSDIFDRKNPIPNLARRIRDEIIAAVSQPITAKITAVIAKIAGIEVPASKQEQAAKEMNIAADKMLRAAAGMNGAAADTGNGSIADAGTVFNPQSTAFAQYAKQILGLGASAYGGYQAGYGIGASTQSETKGAIGGAVSGAVTGAAVGGVPGAIVGGFAGLVGGLVGAGDAAREAERALLAMGVEAHKAAESFHTSLTGDPLDKKLAELQQQYFDVIKKLLDANGGKYPAGFAQRSAVPRPNIADDFNKAAEDYNNAIKKATEDYRRTLTEESEDYHARFLRATGHEAEADAEEFANKQRRERQQLVDSFGDYIDAQEQATLSAYDQAAAAEKAAQAMGTLTTSFHNAPQGSKYADLLYQYGTPRPPIYSVPPPNFPQTPLSGGTTLSRGGSAPITIAPVFNIRGTKVSKDDLRAIGVTLKQVTVEALGSAANVADGWELLTS
jgi:hypothetical protein